MTAYGQKLYAFEKTLQIIEKSAMKNSFRVSDASFQALYNTYEELKKMCIASGESRVSNFPL